MANQSFDPKWLSHFPIARLAAGWQIKLENFSKCQIGSRVLSSKVLADGSLTCLEVLDMHPSTLAMVEWVSEKT